MKTNKMIPDGRRYRDRHHHQCSLGAFIYFVVDIEMIFMPVLHVDASGGFFLVAGFVWTLSDDSRSETTPGYWQEGI